MIKNLTGEHERVILACEKIHKNVLQAIRFWSMFEELNGRSEDTRVALREALATTAYGLEAVSTIRTMVAQTTVLALWRIVDEHNADTLGAAVIRAALRKDGIKKEPRESSVHETVVYKVGAVAADPYVSL